MIVSVFLEVESIETMLSILLLMDRGLFVYLVEENLTVTELPESRQEHTNWCELQNFESQIVESIVEEGWSSIKSCELDSLSYVHDQEGNRQAWKHDRKRKSIRERHKHLIHNCGVSVVQLLLWSSMSFKKLLN